MEEAARKNWRRTKKRMAAEEQRKEISIDVREEK